MVAACLYLVARRSKAPLLLLDFADVLDGIHVRTLGHTFLELCATLQIAPPLLDPALYLHRYAAQLHLADKETAVVETALRFLQVRTPPSQTHFDRPKRMNRDWLQTGRRPSGLCGAALIMACRLHGFVRTPDQLAPIVVRQGIKDLSY